MYVYYVYITHQIVDDLTLDLMAEHDLPVDIVVTPRSVLTLAANKLVRILSGL